MRNRVFIMTITSSHLFFKKIIFLYNSITICKDIQTHRITLFGVQRHGDSSRDFTQSGYLDNFFPRCLGCIHPNNSDWRLFRKGYILDIGQEEVPYCHKMVYEMW